MKLHKAKTTPQKEYIAELLKERIYATLALLAVLISIDTQHYSAMHAAFIVCGTIVSLWAASIVATLMSKRVIYQHELNPDFEREHQLRKHAPMLAALIFPMLMISFAALGIISLAVAINISIVSALLLLMSWSILSARSIQFKKLPTFMLVSAELFIGLSIVALKVALGH